MNSSHTRVEQPYAVNTGNNQPALPLSHSPIWQLQRDFFLRQGIEAWRGNIVPSYITSNPFIAYTYARIVLAFLNDYCSGMFPSAGASQDQPIYLLELGAGSGRFGFHFLRQFFSEYSPEDRLRQKVCYVMTDISPANIEFWRNHEQFQTYVALGLLDFARFDALRDDSLQLLVSGETIGAAKEAPAVVAIANYVFDSIEQDLFEVREGQLYECLTTVKTRGSQAEDAPNPGLDELDLEYQTRLCPEKYYQYSSWNRILQGYRANLKNGAVLFPVGALECLARLRTLSGGRLLVLSGDKGDNRLEAFENSEKPLLVKHGSFSLSVNYHALSEYTEQSGGLVFKRPMVHARINIMGFLFGALTIAPHTRRAYQQYIVDFGPDDFFILYKSSQNRQNSRSLREMIAFLQLSRWDADVLNHFYEPLIAVLQNATLQEKQDLLLVFRQVWENHYRLDKEQNPAFQLGMFAAAMGFFEESIRYYQLSQNLSGNCAAVENNIGLSYYNLGRWEESRIHLQKALELDPELRLAGEVLSRLDAIAAGKTPVQERARGNDSGSNRFNQLEKAGFIREQARRPEIRLEPLSPFHAGALYASVDPEILRLALMPSLTSPEAVLQWVQTLLADSRQRPFAIRHVEYGCIGMISLKALDRSGHFFFWVGREHGGQGFGTTAACQLLQFAFADVGVEELWTAVLPENERSIRILKRLGFECCLHETEDLHFYRCGVDKLSETEAHQSLQRLMVIDRD